MTHPSSRPADRAGFTLIELIIVIAILAFVTVIGIHNFGNVRELQAKKMNATNIKRVYETLATYDTLQREQGAVDHLRFFDALVDAKQSAGAWTGTPGEYEWTDTAVSGQPGIYDGDWKFLLPLKNAAGKLMKEYTSADLEDLKEENKGTRAAGLLAKLAIYHLSTNDCALLRAAGIRTYMLHNPSTGQSGDYAKLPDNAHTVGGGGPGFRPDMSAYYPATLEPGSPVALVKPLESAKGGASPSTIYKDFGYAYTATNALSYTESAQAAMLSTLGVRLVCFGIGQNAECVRNQYGLGEAPVNPVFDKKHYRNYVAVFALKSGGQGVAGSCHLVGVLDCAGQTHRAASYNLNWSSEL